MALSPRLPKFAADSTPPFLGLTAHHTIEERHIFPYLAKRMTAFQNDEVHLKSHEGIHHGVFRPVLCVLTAR